MKQMSTANRLILLVAVLSTLLLVVGSFGLIGLYRSNDALKTVYADRTVPMWQLSEIQRLMQRTWLIVSIGLDMKSPTFAGQYIPDAEANLVSVNTLYAQYLQTYMTPDEKILAENFRRELASFQTNALRPALAALRAQDYSEVRRLQMEVMVPTSNTYRTYQQALSKLQLDVASSEYQRAMAEFESVRSASIVTMVVGVVFALLFGGFLVRSIVRSRVEFEQSLLAKRDLERQLQQSQKVQALGQLTGGIAHDFNNILSAILGYSNLALSRHVPDKDSKLAKYLREVIAASERARDLIAKMLTFTRTQPSDDVTLILPSTVVREVESMMSHSISACIVLHSHFEDDTRILVDAGELNQVLVNLIINARDAVQGQGRIDILVRKAQITNQISLTSHRRFSGEFVVVEVSDTGTGIAPEHMPRLFDPFFTTKDVGKGTGLGLSMVQGIMMRAGGHILVQSTPGRGSCFQLLFPIPIAGQSATSAAGTVTATSAGQGQRIWLVDDESSITGYLEDLLADWGYSTRSFNDPQIALRAFREEAPQVDLLITDLTMPSLSGADLATKMCAETPDMPVIFCTGFTEGFERVRIPDLKTCTLLVKPVASEELAYALGNLLRPTESSAQPQ